MRYRALAVPVLVIGLVIVSGAQPPGPADLPKGDTKDESHKGSSFFEYVPQPSIPAGAAEFSIGLEVEFALENGPVVYRVGLTNRTKEDRECVRRSRFPTVRLVLRDALGWIKKAPEALGMRGSSGASALIARESGPGDHHELIALQNGYQRIALANVGQLRMAGCHRSQPELARTIAIRVRRGQHRTRVFDSESVDGRSTLRLKGDARKCSPGEGETGALGVRGRRPPGRPER